ncbi:MAG: PadR family transcriptional regulator [Bacillota bacterium]
MKHAILGFLARTPRHGYELKGEFDLLTGGLWELNIGQVYSTLERMLREGLVALEAEEAEGDDRKVYRVTPAGLHELQAWLDRPPLKPRPLRDEVLIRLGLLLEQDPGRALALIDSQRRIYHLQLADLTRQKLALRQEAGPAAERLRRELLLDAALQHTEADLRWLEGCESKLRGFIGCRESDHQGGDRP